MIFTLVPTRKDPKSPDLAFLQRSLEKFSNNKVIFLYNKKSIFDCFEYAERELLNSNSYIDEKDTIIFCHDDILVLSDTSTNNTALRKLDDPNTGFIGIAGTSRLSENAVWWRETGYLQGKAYHKGDGGMFCSLYGTNLNTPLVAMDGVFLAIRIKNLRKLRLNKPTSFVGDWDFYDIYYTTQAHFLGLKNYAVDISILHMSLGFPRDTWELNRKAFISMYKEQFPIQTN